MAQRRTWHNDERNFLPSGITPPILGELPTPFGRLVDLYPIALYIKFRLVLRSDGVVGGGERL
jgi:hypothetical protein